MKRRIEIPLDERTSFCKKWGISELSVIGSYLHADEYGDIDILYKGGPINEGKYPSPFDCFKRELKNLILGHCPGVKCEIEPHQWEEVSCDNNYIRKYNMLGFTAYPRLQGRLLSIKQNCESVCKGDFSKLGRIEIPLQGCQGKLDQELVVRILELIEETRGVLESSKIREKWREVSTIVSKELEGKLPTIEEVESTLGDRVYKQTLFSEPTNQK